MSPYKNRKESAGLENRTNTYPPQTVDNLLDWALSEEFLAIRHGCNLQGTQIFKLSGEFITLA